MALLETISLVQKYDGRQVLKDISLTFSRGEAFGLIGPTGAGKTTLLRLLDLLEVPASGKIYFEVMNMTRAGKHRLEIRRRMSFVQQKPLVFTMSVYDNVACGLKWRREGHDTIRKKVDNARELVNLVEYKNRNAKTLSGGETQRLAIARALVAEPEVLFLDEPTANMDPISVSKIEEVLAHIINERKTTIVMTTHNMLQAQRMASRLGV